MSSYQYRSPDPRWAAIDDRIRRDFLILSHVSHLSRPVRHEKAFGHIRHKFKLLRTAVQNGREPGTPLLMLSLWEFLRGDYREDMDEATIRQNHNSMMLDLPDWLAQDEKNFPDASGPAEAFQRVEDAFLFWSEAVRNKRSAVMVNTFAWFLFCAVWRFLRSLYADR